jgi:RHS repeat-associated protein
VDALGRRTSYQYNAYGSRTGLENALGNRTTWSYDGADQLTAEINPLGQRTSYLYDVVGRQEASEDARGYRSSTVYDAAGRAVAQLDALGYRTTLEYDAAGRQVATRDALNYRHTVTYDGAGRVEGTTNPLGHVQTRMYDAIGQLLAAVDALGRHTTTLYDPAGRSVAQQDALGYLTTMVYDPTDQQVALLNANGGRWTTLYDSRSLVRGEQDPCGAWSTYGYDGVGNLTKRTDARSYVTTYAYDAEDRQTSVRYPDNSRVTHLYDALGRETEQRDIHGRRLFTYDPANQVTAVRQVWDDLRLTYAYDVVGNRLRLEAPGTGRTTYGYDGRNQVASIWNPWDDRTTFEYDALRRELHKTLANGLISSHLYDPAGRELVLENRKAGGEALAVYTASYDAVGNRLTVHELDGTRVTYGYDEAYQLVYEARDGEYAFATTYVYDGNGNRLRKLEGIEGAVTTYSYNPADALLVVELPTGQLTTMDWDASGNHIEANTAGERTTYQWDWENRLSGTLAPDGTVETFSYFPDRRRVLSETGAEKTLFLWDHDNLLQERDSAGTLSVQYVNTPDIWEGVASRYQPTGSTFYAPDLQASVGMLVRPDGVVETMYVFTAFGNLLNSASLVGNPYAYKGILGYYQDYLDRIYVRARYLQPDLGRWLSRDPDPDAFASGDLYRYVRQNPVTHDDPSGLRLLPCPPPGFAPSLFCPGSWFRPPCIDVTRDYFRYAVSTGAPFEACASCVSAAICTLIMLGLASGHPLTFALALATQCQNSCMATLWRNRCIPALATPDWWRACQICRRAPLSRQCCRASVRAEQAGYTACAATCLPPLNRWPQPSRIRFGHRLCCT